MSVEQHHRHAGHKSLKVGVLTASDTRSPETDESGRLIRKMLAAAGHRVEYYEVLPDDPARIRAALLDKLAQLDAIIVNGGTGISARDSTIEAVRTLLDKELEGFGELFRYLSYQEIGPAAILSRALAGVAMGKIVVSLPGAPEACRLAMEKLLIPELAHMAHLLKL
ncbi:MAG TPA: molybdenum cofactor biosynthesis protein B [Candidatus Binataceae bacterium]|nr:molybdenum cofactor biosynthesis protein B [Candidatus Binataceae bacterium]